MREPFTQLYLHCVWATWDRLPLLTPALEPRLYGAILQKCRELKALPIRVGGTEDHVHLLVRFPTTCTIADLLQGVKGASSHLMTHQVTPGEFFKWQGAYGAFTLRRDDVPELVRYIANQKAHHANRTAIPEWEKAEIMSREETSVEVLPDAEVMGLG